MADIITRPEPAIAQISPTAVRWTRSDCVALQNAGVIMYRFELVDGIINNMSQNIRHGILVRLILEWLFATFGARFVLTQITIDVRPEDNPTNAPEPDAILLTRPAEELSSNPVPSDLRLCIEAADTTLSYDLNTKAQLYARAGILEYWVVSLNERAVHVHRQPIEGTYRDVTLYSETESVAPLSAPQASVLVSSLLPKALR